MHYLYNPHFVNRECAVVLEQCFTEEEDFVMNLVRKPRLCYQAYFSQSGENKLRYLHPDGNLLVILQEVSMIHNYTSKLKNYVN